MHRATMVFHHARRRHYAALLAIERPDESARRPISGRARAALVRANWRLAAE